MKLTDVQKKSIIQSLEPLDPEKIILFGSYAWGEPDSESDIDLYVVVRDDFMPQNFSEKMELKLSVAKRLAEFRKDFAIDLVVHTKPMHRKFLELNSSFARQIMAKGVVIR